MIPFETLTAIAAPLLRENIDTDVIIPSREMKTVSKTGLGAGLFAGWRYREVGGREPEPGFILNDPAYADARILLSGGNFGCGSSRQHAAWALADYGFRAIIAPSFNPIFRGNCVRSGVVPVELAAPEIAAIAAEAPGLVAIDLPAQRVCTAFGATFGFAIDAEAKEMLRYGLDAITLTLSRHDAIDAFLAADRSRRPWVYWEAVS